MSLNENSILGHDTREETITLTSRTQKICNQYPSEHVRTTIAEIFEISAVRILVAEVFEKWR